MVCMQYPGHFLVIESFVIASAIIVSEKKEELVPV